MDFFGINGYEFVVLILLATFIFGPDRLPKAIADGVKMLRNLRDMARNATGDLSRELGTDISLEDLNPKALIRKHLLSEEDERALRQPFEDLRSDVTGLHSEFRGSLRGAQSDLKKVSSSLKPTFKPVSTGGPVAMGHTDVAHTYDDDAT